MYIDIRKKLTIYLTVLILLGTCVLSIQADLNDPTLSVYYSFDEESKTVKDGSKNGNDGEVEGNAKWEKGVYGNAIALETNVWVNMNGAEFKNGPVDGFTLAVWVNHTGSADPQTLLDAIGSAHESGLYHMEIRPGGFRFFHRNETNTEVFNINPGPVIDADKWVHFAGTYDSDSGDAKTYIDGKETHSAKGSGKLSAEWGVNAGIGHHKMVVGIKGCWMSITFLIVHYLKAKLIRSKQVNFCL